MGTLTIFFQRTKSIFFSRRFSSAIAPLIPLFSLSRVFTKLSLISDMSDTKQKKQSASAYPVVKEETSFASA